MSWLKIFDKKRERYKRSPKWNGKSKTTFLDDRSLYMQNPEAFTV